MSRKPRADAKLRSLPPHQKDRLIAWLGDENLSYAEAKKRLKEEFGVKTSTGALSDFFATEVFILRNRQAKALADELGEELRADPERFDDATVGIITQRAFELVLDKEPDLDQLAIFAKILGDRKKLQLKERDQALTERRIRLLEEAADQAKKAQDIAGDGDLSPEEKERRIKAVFGLT